MKELKLQGQLGVSLTSTKVPSVRQHVEVQQHYVESLRQEIQVEQRRNETELEREQAHLQQQHNESKFFQNRCIKKKLFLCSDR